VLRVLRAWSLLLLFLLLLLLLLPHRPRHPFFRRGTSAGTHRDAQRIAAIARRTELTYCVPEFTFLRIDCECCAVAARRKFSVRRERVAGGSAVTGRRSSAVTRRHLPTSS
jgi:hypothetical protein